MASLGPGNLVGSSPGSAGGLGSGIVIYDVAGPNFLAPTAINAYTTLGIPAYFRALKFRCDSMASFKRYVALNGVETKHPLTPLLQRRPNALNNSNVFWRLQHFHLAHFANGFAEIKRDSLYRPTAMVNVLPEFCKPFRWKADDDDSVYQFYYVGGTAPHIVAAIDMIHWQGLSYDGQAGLNPVSLLYETFERARLIDRYTTKFLVKGGMVKGSIEIPSGASKDQQQSIIDTVRTQFTGADAERDILVLSDGATFNNKGISPKDSELIAQAHYVTVQIAQITGVDPVLLFDMTDSKYGNSQLVSDAVMRDLFRPLIELEESELNLKLLSDQEFDAGYRICIDADSIIRGDPKLASDIIIAETGAGIITRNEARAETGYPKSTDPEADKLKTLGDTAPPKASTPAPQTHAAPKIGVECFSAVIVAAVERVETKTAKASATAHKKFADDREGMIAWANVFSAEQAGYARDSILPVLDAINAVCLPDLDIERVAQRIGDQYADGLKRQLYANGPAAELFTIIKGELK